MGVDNSRRRRRSELSESQTEKIQLIKKELRLGLEDFVKLQQIQFLKFEESDPNKAHFQIVVYQDAKKTVEELTDLVEETVQNVIDSSSNLEGEIELVSTSEVVNFEKTKDDILDIPDDFEEDEAVAELLNSTNRF